MSTKVLVACLVVLGVAQSKDIITGKPTTKFYDCPTSIGSKVKNIIKKLGGGGNQPDLCFDAVLKTLIVQVGKPGTDDDVFARVCSDVDGKQCCKTPALKSKLSDDWSKNDRETWGERYFGSKKGECKNFVFKVKRGLSVTLIKSNDSPLQVKSINVITKSKDPKKIPDEMSFECGTFLFGNGRQREQNHLCKSGPYYLGRFHSMNVTTGSDGTSDNVMYKICSDVDDFCCQTEPGRLLSNDYKKGKTDKRVPSDFGKCAKQLYKIRTRPTITVIKDGKDSLVVRNLEFAFKRQDQDKIIKLRCEGFSYLRECKPLTVCTQQLICV